MPRAGGWTREERDIAVTASRREPPKQKADPLEFLGTRNGKACVDDWETTESPHSSGLDETLDLLDF